MTEEKKQISGHLLACGTQMMWGATFISTKVLLQYFMPVEVLFTRAVLAFITLFLFWPHHLRLKDRKQEFVFAGAGLFGLVLYFMLENTALTMTYASNVGIIVACAPFFVAVTVGWFFKEKSGSSFYIGFLIAITGVTLISFNGQKELNLNPMGDGLAFLAMVSWGFYSALIKKISEWDYPVIAVTRRIYFDAILFLIPVLIHQHASWDLALFGNPQVVLNFLFLGIGASATGFLFWNLATKWIGAVRTSVYIYVSPVVTVILSVLILHEKVTMVSALGTLLIFAGLVISQKRKTGGCVAKRCHVSEKA